jgi:DNA polymerase (family 10)
MDNAQIAEVFEDIARLLELKGEESVFTVRAYERAARSIALHPADVERMVRDGVSLREIPGVGEAISAKITELVKTGKLDYYERLKADFPEGVREMMRIPGLGPKTTMRLWKELGVASVAELEQAIQDGRLAAMPRMGKKTAENILREIQFARTKGVRMPIGKAMRIAERLAAELRERCPGISTLAIAGSLRRFEETIGDIDLVCVANNPHEALDALAGLPSAVDVLGHGEAKTSVVLSSGIQVDMRVVDERRFGAMLMYFTGNRQHSIQLRDLANDMGLTLSEYGLTHADTGQMEEFADEQSLYARLGLQYIPPELRMGAREISLAREGQIPRLVELSDIKGDLHDHTDWSDGRDPMEAMVFAAKARGLEYVAITDHSAGRGVANGLSIARLREHMARLRELEGQIGGIRVLCGTEMDIRADGTLDYPDDVLKELDWVIASIHSAMNQDSATMTDRIVKAMRSPYVSAIGHLSTRLIGERQPINADYEALFRAAAETGTALEINASPERLDLKDAHAYRARELGAPLVISTDSHTVEAMENMRFGVAVARRAWCESRHIINTMPASEFLAWLRLDKAQRAKAIATYA